MTAAAALADPENGTLDDIVDTDRYALGAQASVDETRLLASEVGQELMRQGSVTLPGFLRADALEEMAAQIATVSEYVPIRHHAASVYARKDLEETLPPGDPRSVKQEWYAGHVTRDMIAPYTASHRLYVSPAFKRFVAQVVGLARVFEYADPLAGLVATVLPPGGRYPWHYDTNEFVLTLMLQKPDAGGQFEYHQNLRRAGHENLEALGRVLSGSATDAKISDVEPGDLQLFLGRHSLHRVTEVLGDRARHVLVLSYTDRPGVIGPVDRTRSVYGRITEAHLVAAESRRTGADGLIL